jgi:hypothetical protein
MDGNGRHTRVALHVGAHLPDDVVRNLVAVDHRQAVTAEQLSDGAFAAGYPSRQPNDTHRWF